MTAQELTVMISEATLQRHKLVTGRLPIVVVDQNGERVEYQRATIHRLDAYIKKLRRELENVQAGRTGSTGPLRVCF